MAGALVLHLAARLADRYVRRHLVGFMEDEFGIERRTKPAFRARDLPAAWTLWLPAAWLVAWGVVASLHPTG